MPRKPFKINTLEKVRAMERKAVKWVKREFSILGWTN
jgi:hypothetical protein